METKNTHFLYGAGAGIGTVIIALILHIAKLDDKPVLGWVAYIPFIAGIIMNGRAFAKANDGYVTFKSVFGSCFKATMIVALCMVTWTVISIYAFPEMKEMAIEKAREEMLKKPGMTDDAMEMALSFTRKGYSTILISAAVFGSLIMGAIFSVIAAAVAPKKGERPVTDSF